METPAGPEDVANFVFTTEVKPWRRHFKEFARQNRRQPTEAEAILWQALRNTKLGVLFAASTPSKAYRGFYLR